MEKLKDKIAVITGGNSGIGYGIAQELIAQGANVVITGRSQKAVEEAEKSFGAGATGLVANQSSLADLTALADQVKKQFDHIDTLVINAGIMYMSSIEGGCSGAVDQ